MQLALKPLGWSSLPVAVALAIWPCAAQAQLTVQNRRTIDVTFATPDRQLRQALTQAQEAVTQEQYSDAVEQLGKILAATTTEDYFLPGTGETVRSIKSEAIRLLDKLPPKGRERYELLHGAAAKASLDRALADRNTGLLADIVARYFHTAAGQDAAMLLARLHLNDDRPLSAAVLYSRVGATSGEKYDPELPVLEAIAWKQAGRDEKSQAALLALKKRAPQAKIRTRNGDVKLFQADDEALTWLTKLMGDVVTTAPTADEWAMFRGTPTRNGLSATGEPLPHLRTQFETADTSAVGRDLLRTIERKSQEQGIPLLPVIQPIAVGDLVITRNFERLVASRFDNGLRIWAFPFGTTLDPDFDPRAQNSSNPRNESSLRQRKLEQRLFEDAAYGQISSDGEQVFALEGLPAAVPSPNPRLIGVRAGQAIFDIQTMKTFNRLVALDIRTQGKLRWSVGGEKGEMEPKLAGAFFLGAPLPFQRQLYALAEIKGEIRLVVLNAQTGQLEWSQQLAQTETRSVVADPTRRLAGASPAMADGVLICPTSAGAVVAIDLHQRSLLWGYVYPRADLSMLNDGNPWNRRPAPMPVGTRWVDSSPTVAGSYILFTPPESDELHCLDLLTGRPVWLPLKRSDLLENMLYLACVKDQTVMLVGRDKVVAVDLKSGKPAWAQPLSLSAWPSGRGVYDGEHYFLPLASSELLKIDVAKGAVAARLPTESPLGNLVSHRGDLISQTAEHCSIYHLRKPLEQLVASRLKVDSGDVWALTRQGELLAAAGKTTEALNSLRTAQQKNPDDADARATLVRALLTALRTAPADNTLALEVEKLIDQPAQRAEFLRLQADGSLKAGRFKEACLAYLRLAEAVAPASGELSSSLKREEPEKGLQVRTDRWLQGRLLSAYRQASEADKAALDEEIGKRLAAIPSQATLSPGGMLAILGFHPSGGPAALEFARRNAGGDKPLTTQSILLPLLDSSDERLAAAATRELVKLYQQQNRAEVARPLVAALAGRFAEVAVDGQTGKAWSENLLAQSPAGRLKPVHWPAGKVEVNNEVDRPARIAPYERRTPIPLAVAAHSFEHLQPFYEQGLNRLVVNDGLGRLVVSVGLTRDATRINSMNAPLHAAVRGNLMIAVVGSEILAIDLFRSGYDTPEALLWRQDTGERAVNQFGVYSVQRRTLRNPVGGYRQIEQDTSGRLLNSPVAIGAWGVCFARGKQLVCLDALTGEVLWERMLTNSPQEIFGDDDHLFVASPNESTALVLNPWDGVQLGTREIRPLENRWTTRGRNLLHWTEEKGKVRLDLTDLWTKENLWSREVTTGTSSTRGCLIQGDELAIYEPDGKFRIVSLETGKETLEQQLAPNSTLLGLHVIRSSEQYLILANEPPAEIDTQFSHRPPSPELMQHPFVSGRVYAFDRATGKQQWQTSAYVAQYCLPLEQPVENPLVFFIRNSTPVQSDFRAKPVTGLVCLDKRTGRALYQAQLPYLAPGFDLWADPEKKTVNITLLGLEQKTTELRFTDQPTPPEPPAQLGPMSSLSRGEQPGKSVDTSEGLFQLEKKKP